MGEKLAQKLPLKKRYIFFIYLLKTGGLLVH